MASNNSISPDGAAGASSSNTTSNNTIQLDHMSLEQLDQLKAREESRLQILLQRYNVLRQAATRLQNANHVIQELYIPQQKQDDNDPTKQIQSSTIDDNNNNTNPIITTKDVFVPLTESVYVPGTIQIQNPNEALLIELGTGYFIEQNPINTIDYLQRKLRLVNTNSDNVTQAIQATRHNVESINITMRGKIVEIQARQQGQRIQAADIVANSTSSI